MYYRGANLITVGNYRRECKDCNHVVVCREDLKTNLEGLCPFYEPLIK